jgi:uncharacterized membrane protein
MEVISILLFFVIIYLLVNNGNNYNKKITDLEFRILELKNLLQQNLAKDKPVPAPPTPVAEAPPKPVPVEEKKPEPVVPEKVQPWSAEIVEKYDVVIEDFSTISKPIKTKFPQYKPAEPKQSFFDRYPDLEKFIGENLINKIGIAILVLAIGFFVKYAIDNNWIGPVGRVGIGVLCSGILIGIAHRLRNSYKAFSSVLVGGGLAVLYFTITLAYHQFHLFNQTTSFIILIVITCFAVVLSLLYNKQELAVIALIGGLGSPFMVSGDTANYHALFIYLIILNTGLLVIAYNKLWRILNISAFALTVLVVSATIYTLSPKTYVTGLLYSTILYLLYFFITVANNIRENKKFMAADFTILLTNTALYFAAGLYLLTAMHQEQLRGLFAASLGGINLVLSFILFRNRKVDTNILYLLIGITLTFLSLTAPIQLHGHNITLFWAAETVLLFWLYQRSGIKLMKLTSLIIWGAMLISLWMDLMNVYDSVTVITIMANKGFITSMVAAISSYLLYLLTRKEEKYEIYHIQINPEVYRYAAVVLLFIGGLLEVNGQFLNRYPDTELNILYLMLYVPAFIFILYLLVKRFAAVKPAWQVTTIVLALCIFVYLLNTQQLFDLQYGMLIGHTVSTSHFIAHWIGTVFIGLIFYQLIQTAKNTFPEGFQSTAAWVIAGAIVLFLSLELNLTVNLLFYSKATTLDELTTIYIKVGLPILWGALSFALMWLGMRNKARTLRIMSLTLFSITLIKLFVFDIQHIPPAGKIAAFFCLGVLLLIVSFMYQKVKKIIVDDEAPKQD